MKCGLCHGPLNFLGVLGHLAWFVCRNCGMQWNKPANRQSRAAQKRINS